MHIFLIYICSSLKFKRLIDLLLYVILYWLVEYKTIRFNELQRKIGTITYKTLSTELKKMEADGLIIRKEYPQIPPKVEYSLSDKGRSLYPIMESMCQWGTVHSEKLF